MVRAFESGIGVPMFPMYKLVHTAMSYANFV